MIHRTELEGEDLRIGAARDLLRGHGLGEVRLTVAGNRQEIAALAAPAHLARQLAEVAPAIKALGFHYVALDLAPAEITD